MHFKPSPTEIAKDAKTYFRRKLKSKSSLVILRMISIVKLKHEVNGKGFNLKRALNSLTFWIASKVFRNNQSYRNIKKLNLKYKMLRINKHNSSSSSKWVMNSECRG